MVLLQRSLQMVITITNLKANSNNTYNHMLRTVKQITIKNYNKIRVLKEKNSS